MSTGIEIGAHADRAEYGVRCAGGTMDIESQSHKTIHYVLDLLVGGAFLHYYDHDLRLSPHARSRPGDPGRPLRIVVHYHAFHSPRLIENAFEQSPDCAFT